MDIKELRVGNKIWRPCCYDEVVEIRENGIIGIDSLRGLIPYSDIEPIPITDELLLKIGFKKENEYIAVKPDKSCLVHFPNHFITGEYFVIAIARLPGMPSAIPVKHLHQLQNAYYLLTGEELEIKP